MVYSIRTPVVQTWLVQRVASYLSSELNTTITLDRIQIEFFRTLSIKNLYVEDLHGDTLLSAGELNTVIDMFSPGNNKIYLSGVDLKNATFKLQKYPNEKGLNINFIIDYFDSEKKDTSATAPFDFNPGEVRLTNVEFVYRDNRYEDDRDGVDFDYIRVRNIQADIDNVRFDKDTVYATIENITFIEKSGFELEYFESTARFTPESMSFENLLIKTAETQLQGNLTFNFDSFDDFDDFIEKVKITSQFEESILSSNDLRYFAPELEGLDQVISFNGKIRGTIDQLRGRDLEIAFANRSRFKGDISIAGLPDFEESFFDLVIDELITDKADIESIPTYPFTLNEKLFLPENLATLGSVKFNGKFTGFLNDFVAYGNASTAIGFISSDINLKIDQQVKKSSYSGHLSVVDFDIGVLTDNTKLLGKTTFKAELKGSGLSLERVNAQMIGIIHSLDLNGYTYNNIDVNGQIAQKLFNGTLLIEEENLNLDFHGTIDLTTNVPEYNFTTNISNAKLAKLNIIDRDTTAVLNTSATINIKGTDLNDLTGYILIGKTEYQEINDQIEIDSISYISYFEDGIQKATLESDIVDFTLIGSYRRSSMFREIEYLVTSFIPTFINNESRVRDHLDVTYELTFKKTDEILAMFYPKLVISPGTTINGEINNTTRRINVRLLSNSITYSEGVFNNINFKAETSGDNLWIRNEVDEIVVSDTLRLYKVRLDSQTDKFKSSISLSSLSRDSVNNKMNIKSEINYLASGRILFKILPSNIMVNGKNWNIDVLNTTIFDSSLVNINNLAFVSNNEYVLIDGTISKNETDNLNIVLRNFDTRILNPVFAIHNFEMFGIASGNAKFSGMLSTPGISGNMNITDAGVYGDTLGNAAIDFRFNTTDKIIFANAVVDRGGDKNIDIRGKYYISSPQDSVNFDIELQKTNVSTFSGYAKGLASDLRGKASGSLKLRGPVNSLALTGKIRLQQTSFLVDYLNTRYNFSEEVELTEKYFRFQNFRVNDENGNQAMVDGYIYHTNLRDFILNFNISARNFQMLNTTHAHNELFYGDAYGTGNVRITGPLDLIKMNIAIKTEKNTQLFIPLTNPEEVSKISYINFITRGSEPTMIEEKKVDFSGIEMDFDLDVTPDAEIQLIFDSKIGDLIRGRGIGNIKMEINTQGDFKMYGNYQVYSGDYLFTLQNLINKKFIINPGGTIRWSGSPYDAEIDIHGVYRLRASLYDLIQDTTLTRRIPVYVNLHLTESLFNPAINFSITIPDIDPTADALVNRYISTEQEKRTQTMSLLVLNRFSPAVDVEVQGTSSSGVGANAAELLSQQLSVWASQISSVVNVGVNYRAADAFNQEEVEVALSTQLFNDRVILDGNVGVSDNYRNTSNIVGDFNVEVKVSQDGRLRFKAFNKTIDNSILNNYNSAYTQGVGVFYMQEFNTIGELFRNRGKLRKNTDPEEPVL